MNIFLKWLSLSTLADEAPKMIILALGHSTMYLPMAHVIQCMGNMTVMVKIYF